MDDEHAVMRRLDRIDQLQRDGAPAADLLDEVRRLLRAAERLARQERATGLDTALERCREALAGGELERRLADGSRGAGTAVDRIA